MILLQFSIELPSPLATDLPNMQTPLREALQTLFSGRKIHFQQLAMHLKGKLKAFGFYFKTDTKNYYLDCSVMYRKKRCMLTMISCFSYFFNSRIYTYIYNLQFKTGGFELLGLKHYTDATILGYLTSLFSWILYTKFEVPLVYIFCIEDCSSRFDERFLVYEDFLILTFLRLLLYFT